MFATEIDQFRVILGSSSPRRKELLSALGLSFSIHSPDFEEAWIPGETPEEYVQRNALGKAESVVNALNNESDSPSSDPLLIIGSDTIVVLDDEILEKPHDEDHAREMLTRLSGRTHDVYTGICVLGVRDGKKTTRDAVVITSVQFCELTTGEIDWYIASGEPLDKAGGYALQGIGGSMVKAIEGSYSNVIGLPLAETKDLVAAFLE